MCLTIPGKIKSIKDGVATVENGARTEQVELGIVFDAKVGDWVLYATNRAVRLIDEDEAYEIIELLEDNYQPVDIKALPLEYKLIVSKIRNPNIEIRNNGKITKKQETRNKQIKKSKIQNLSQNSNYIGQNENCHPEGSRDLQNNLVDSSQNTQNDNKKICKQPTANG